jgi:hypothetical protein
MLDFLAGDERSRVGSSQMGDTRKPAGSPGLATKINIAAQMQNRPFQGHSTLFQR